MEGFCYKTARIWVVVGYAFLILKIVVPILIIILGIVDLAKAVISSDEKFIKDGVFSVVKRILIGILIFCVPSIVSYVFTLISGFDELNGDYINCIQCVTSPNDNCDTSYKGEIFE